MAVHVRLADAYRTLLEAFAGPGVRISTTSTLVIGRTAVAIPDFNRVMSRSPDAVPAEAEVDAALAALADTPVHSWWLPDGPARGLEPRLVARGYAGPDGPDVPAMWLDTADLSDPALPAGVEVEVVRTAAEADELTATAADGFGVPPHLVPPIGELFRGAAERDDPRARMFIARLEGRPVATAMAALAGDTVGVYTVATVPDARGRGIGGAVTLAAILEARARGATVAVLESSAMGLPVYRRLGFEIGGDFRILGPASAA